MTFWDGFYSFGVKLLKIIYLNFLWLFFSAIGLFAFGLFPATIALFTITRQFLLDIDKPITRTFWEVYKNEWVRGNGYAVISYIIVLILAIDFYAIYMFDSLSILLIPTFIIAFIIFGTLFFFFPVYVHFDLAFLPMIKQAFLFTITSPYTVILNALCIVLIYGIFNIMPGAIPLFAGSVLSWFVMKFSLRSFKKIEQRKVSEAVT
ncbi:YesL family protein [Solibacillus sp. FSL K6-1554]|uniref:YesL family protein n=1 Tax=Solibacillus sp. FSL K6-1554 TaxID=2921472 RepID=UPI0030F5C60C